MPPAIGRCLEYAIYHSPLPFIRILLERNLPAVELLLAAGADPRLRTRIDDGQTPRELAEQAGLPAIAELLAVREARLGR